MPELLRHLARLDSPGGGQAVAEEDFAYVGHRRPPGAPRSALWPDARCSDHPAKSPSVVSKGAPRAVFAWIWKDHLADAHGQFSLCGSSFPDWYENRSSTSWPPGSESAKKSPSTTATRVPTGSLTNRWRATAHAPGSSNNVPCNAGKRCKIGIRNEPVPPPTSRTRRWRPKS